VKHYSQSLVLRHLQREPLQATAFGAGSETQKIVHGVLSHGSNHYGSFVGARQAEGSAFCAPINVRETEMIDAFVECHGASVVTERRSLKIEHCLGAHDVQCVSGTTITAHLNDQVPST
jgi:hypothetical protein